LFINHQQLVVFVY